jgi:predicted anti-sigma-YlaC factor YlaD
VKVQRSVLNTPLVRAVFGLPDNCLRCNECQAWLPAYVDAEVRGIADDPCYRPVKYHLLLCSECVGIYLEVLGLALVEEGHCLPRPARYSEPDLSFLSEREGSDE